MAAVLGCDDTYTGRCAINIKTTHDLSTHTTSDWHRRQLQSCPHIHSAPPPLLCLSPTMASVADAAPDELFTVKAHFWLGNYQQAISAGTSLRLTGAAKEAVDDLRNAYVVLCVCVCVCACFSVCLFPLLSAKCKCVLWCGGHLCGFTP